MCFRHSTLDFLVDARERLEAMASLYHRGIFGNQELYVNIILLLTHFEYVLHMYRGLSLRTACLISS